MSSQAQSLAATTESLEAERDRVAQAEKRTTQAEERTKGANQRAIQALAEAQLTQKRTSESLDRNANLAVEIANFVMENDDLARKTVW